MVLLTAVCIRVGRLEIHVVENVSHAPRSHRLNVSGFPSLVPHLEVLSTPVRSKALHAQRSCDAALESPRLLLAQIMVDVPKPALSANPPSGTLLEVNALVEDGGREEVSLIA